METRVGGFSGAVLGTGDADHDVRIPNCNIAHMYNGGHDKLAICSRISNLEGSVKLRSMYKFIPLASALVIRARLFHVYAITLFTAKCPLKIICIIFISTKTEAIEGSLLIKIISNSPKSSSTANLIALGPELDTLCRRLY